MAIAGDNDKILLIDDDPSLVELVQYNLEDEGYEVVTAQDGQAGVRFFFTDRPDLLLQVLESADPRTPASTSP